MIKINLNDCFPEPGHPDVSRGPLPKQALFFQLALNDGLPKYIRYVGGIGSGKTLIGCITVLSWAIQHSGDYLIARQFMPELRDTTYKTFLELCPDELIQDHRVADSIIRIKNAEGGISNILFRALEEPDKLRSLNLNAFYIDEANQVAEEAFILLQGRLRGRSVRKGILTQNSGGHDWSWRWFVKQDMIKNKEVKNLFVNIVAPSTENYHLPDGYVETMLDTWSEDRIKREIYADEDSFEGQVYTEFNQQIHVISPFKIPAHWPKVVGADHGFRNPAAWIWGAIDDDENLYIYREFYQSGWLINEILNGKKDDKTGKRIPELPGTIELCKNEVIDGIYMDPSTKAKRGKQAGSEWDEYLENFPANWSLLPANNAKTAGIDRVKQFLKIDPKLKQPKMFIFNTCVNLINEIQQYRYQELSSSRKGRLAEKEEPVKINDHALDALRYLVMSRPEPNLDDLDYYKQNNVKYTSLEGKLHRDLEQMRSPTPKKDPFGD